MEFGLFLSFLGFFFTAVILVVAFLYLYALPDFVAGSPKAFWYFILNHIY